MQCTWILLFCFILITVKCDWIPKDWKDYIPLDIQQKYLGKDLGGTISDKLFEGDINGIDKEISHIKLENTARNVVDDEKLRWVRGIVPYQISTLFTQRETQFILRAMKLMTDMTFQCVKFVEHSNETDYIRIIKGLGCSSDVGRQGGQQPVILTRGCLEEFGDTQHELMHTLGFYHEMSRKDRDDFVYINEPNVRKDAQDQFRKFISGNTFDLPYDYASVMHYPITAFAIDNNVPTIVPKQRGARLGQRKNISPLDVAKIQMAYKCGAIDPDLVDSSQSMVTTTIKTVTPTTTALVTQASTTTPSVSIHFSSLPLTSAECHAQFSANCGPFGYTRDHCIDSDFLKSKSLTIACGDRATCSEISIIANSLNNPAQQPKGIYAQFHGGNMITPNSIAAIRTRIIVFLLWDCKSTTFTSNFPALNMSNLHEIFMADCLNLIIHQHDFQANHKLQVFTLWKCTISQLEYDTFMDLPALHTLSLERNWAEPPTDVLIPSLTKLHCSCSYKWLRNWFQNKPILLDTIKDREVFNLSNIGNPTMWKGNLYQTVDCTKGISSPNTHQDYPNAYTVNDNCDGNDEILPNFTRFPVTMDECQWLFTSNCGNKLRYQRNRCAGKGLKIQCNPQTPAVEVLGITQKLAVAMVDGVRDVNVDVYDGEIVNYNIFQPIRKNVMSLYINQCVNGRTTGKLPLIQLTNLLHFQLSSCQNLVIYKSDFDRNHLLRDIILYRSSIKSLETGTFMDLPNLQFISLEWRNFPLSSAEYVYWLHCSVEMCWCRLWLKARPDLIQPKRESEIYNTPKWMNTVRRKNDIFVPVDCQMGVPRNGVVNYSQNEYSLHDNC